jgi:predicted transcriptional regulator
VRTTDTMTISLPPAMAKQMAKVQKAENRTRSELMREAWRLYFESHYPIYTPTKLETGAIRKGRAEMKRGQFVTLEQLRHEMDPKHGKAGAKNTRKSSR